MTYFKYFYHYVRAWLTTENYEKDFPNCQNTILLSNVTKRGKGSLGIIVFVCISMCHILRPVLTVADRLHYDSADMVEQL